MNETRANQLELCSNFNLSHLLEAEQFLEFNKCATLIRQVLNGACSIHDNNIIHRDIKLDNVLLNENLQVKIGYFGLAIETNASEVELQKCCGTVTYSAPES